MQRHYRRLILLLILLHVSVVRPSSSRITQQTADVFLEYSFFYFFMEIGLITDCLGRWFCLVYNFHMPLALKVGCLFSGVGCDIA
jgi:hypothetical protein